MSKRITLTQDEIEYLAAFVRKDIKYCGSSEDDTYITKPALERLLAKLSSKRDGGQS